MNRTAFVLAAFLAWAAAGCVKELTGAGEQVRMGKAEPVGHCTELAMVYGSGTGGSYNTAENKMKSAENELRNRAAEEGANYVVMDAIGSDVGGMTISGRAFRCDQLPSNLSPAPAPAPAPAGGQAAAPAAASTSDPEARLRKLKGLLDKGLITQEEYDQRRAEILQSL